MKITTLNRMLVLFTRLLDRKQSTVPLVAPTGEKPLCASAAGRPLPTATPEDEGVSSRVLAAFFEELRSDPTLDMHRVTVMRNGRVLAEATFGDWDPTVWRTTFSASKSVIALAIGCLVDDNLLQAEDRVLEYFPEETNVLTRVKWRDLTVEDLLTMRSGSSFNEFAAIGEENWVKNFWASTSAGKEFRYNSLNTYMLAALIQRITGKSVCDFLRERLFDPLGIGEVYWETCPRGTEKGGWGLYIHPTDMAKLGQLVMQGGVWDGRRLLSEEWITRATAKHMITPAEYGDYNYGYHIWVSRGDGNRFLFNGMFGQNVLGFRNNGILLVCHAGNNELFQQSRFYKIAHRTFGGNFPQSLTADPDGEEQLEDTLASLRAVYPQMPRVGFFKRLLGVKADPLPKHCYQTDGASFTADAAATVGLLPLALQMVTNRYTTGLTALRTAVEGQEAVLYYREGREEHRLPLGLYAPARTVLRFGEDAYAVSVHAKVATDEEDRPVWILTLYFLETPFTRRLKLTFAEEKLILEQSETPGEVFVGTLIDTATAGLSKQPLVGGAVQKLDPDYMHYKIERLFLPRVTLKKR